MAHLKRWNTPRFHGTLKALEHATSPWHTESAGTRHVSMAHLKQQVLVRQPAVLPIHKDFFTSCHRVVRNNEMTACWEASRRHQDNNRTRVKEREMWWRWQNGGEEDEGVNHGTNGANDSLVTVDKRLETNRQKENNWLSITTKAPFVNSYPGNVTT